MYDPERIEKYWDMGPCCICGRLAYNIYGGGALRLKGDPPICGNCVRKLRPLYPNANQRKPSGDITKNDPLTKLTPEEAKAAMAQVTERFEELRSKYAPYNAVFRIDDFHAEKQGLFKPPINYFKGFGLFGRFNPGEQAVLLHEGYAIPILLEEVQNAFPLEGADGEPGYLTTIKVTGKNIAAVSGDIIAK